MSRKHRVKFNLIYSGEVVMEDDYETPGVAAVKDLVCDDDPLTYCEEDPTLVIMSVEDVVDEVRIGDLLFKKRNGTMTVKIGDNKPAIKLGDIQVQELQQYINEYIEEAFPDTWGT